MHLALCLVQAGLAIQFINHGWFYLNMPAQMQAAMGLPDAVRLLIAAAELAGGAGLVLPALLRRWAKVTVAAALGLAAVGVLATGFHLLRGEAAYGLNPMSLALIALGVAQGRRALGDGR